MAISASLAVSCTVEEEILNTPSVSDRVSITYSVADFQGINVGTRAVEDDEKEVNDITMAIFASDGAIVGGIVNVEVAGADPVFMIDTKHTDDNGTLSPFILAGAQTIPITNNQATLDQCTIYMLANSWEVLKDKNISSETQLLETDFPVEGITIPENGFPMMGKAEGTIDLSADRADDATQMEDITMRKLYSKINVKFQINADNVISIPKFQITGWKVTNIPTKVRLGEPADNQETTPSYGDGDAKTFGTSPSTQLSEGSKPTISHSVSLDNPDSFEFSFYMPEHQVNSDVDYSYPTGITEVEKQRFKPLLCSGEKTPVYVTVEGVYTDHQDVSYEVKYNLYLGQNSVDDFHVKRNQLLKNVVTIKGLTNSNPGEGAPTNISTDYRVEVGETGNYVVKVERDAALDSHFEVRPMDIFISGGGKVKATVMDKTSTDATPDRIWLRMEQGGKTGNDYTGSTGVRKYFTTNLVTTTLADSGKTLEVSGEKSRIWLYFDENPNVFDKTILPTDVDNYNTYKNRYRDISIQLEYYNAAGVKDESQTRTITFRQMNLWRLWSYTDDTKTTKSRFYDIEYHEEYLYNYAADQGFGVTKDGMAWGLNGVQLSDAIQSMQIRNTGLDDIANHIVERVKPFYDFYIRGSESNGMTYRAFGGKTFSNDIMEKILYETTNNTDYIGDGLLTTSPKNAVEYCYNKNKRNDDGTIITKSGNNYNTNNVCWFLPSIDQIEEIVKSGYLDFIEFQSKWYWASQPAYDRYYWKYYSWFGSDVDGYLYQDDLSNARATKITHSTNSEEEWIVEPSGSSNINSNLVGNYSWSPTTFLGGTGLSTNKDYTGNNSDNSLDSGNQPRTNINRIRCVRNTGTYTGN